MNYECRKISYININKTIDFVGVSLTFNKATGMFPTQYRAGGTGQVGQAGA